MAVHIFRILDLPAEIRLMIYDALPVTTKHHILIDATHINLLEKYILWSPPGPFEAPATTADTFTPSTFTLVIKTVPVVLRATCRQINKESIDAFQRKLKFISREPLRLVIDAPSLSRAFQSQSFALDRYIYAQGDIVRKISSISRGIRPSLRYRSGFRIHVVCLQAHPIVYESPENDQVCEFAYKCAASIEARSPPHRSVAVLVLPHTALSDPHEIEKSRMSCRANLWGSKVRDCLSVEYSVPAEAHEKMYQKQLFIPTSQDEIDTIWGAGVSYI